jgi:serine protease Do
MNHNFKICPKCSYSIKNVDECENCGLIFEKYIQFEEQKKRKAELHVYEVQNSKLFWSNIILHIGVVILIVIAIQSRVYIKNHFIDKLPSLSDASVEERGEAESEVIHRASLATVTVLTPWTQGSGFFIDKRIIVTNKHVIEVSTELKQYNHQLEMQLWAIHKDIYPELKIFRPQFQVQNLRMDQAAKIFQDTIRDLPESFRKIHLLESIQKFDEDFQEFRKRREDYKFGQPKEKIPPKDIEIILGNGIKYPTDSTFVSTYHDLTLLVISSTHNEVLQRRGGGKNLAIGQTLYAIGTPGGRRNEVTTGKLLSYVKDSKNDELYIKTDIPVDHGNSGGPCVDVHGNIVGVITRGREGQESLVIPIEIVLKVFADNLEFPQ